MTIVSFDDPKPGIYYGVSFNEYRAIKAVNCSSIKKFEKSAKAYKHAQGKDDADSKPNALGRAIHAAVLEPAKFMTDFAQWPGVRKGKAYTEFAEANHDKEILNGTESDTVVNIVEAVNGHRFCSDKLTGGEPEVTIIFDHPATGIRCKGRLDYLNLEQGYIVDLKSTKDAEYLSFRKDVANFQYHWSAAFYRNGITTLTGERLDFYLIAAENVAPFDVVPYLVSNEMFNEGQLQVTNAMEQLKACVETGIYPGISEEPIELDLPPWAITEESKPVTLNIGGERVEV